MKSDFNSPFNVKDFLPDELLEIPTHDHWDSFERLRDNVIITATVGIVSIVVGLALAVVNLPFYFAGFFLLLASVMFFLLVYAVFVHGDERSHFEWRRNNYSLRLTISSNIITLAITNLTIVQKARDVTINNTDAEHKPNLTLLYPEVDRDKNETYEVATVILKQALTAWRNSGNQRPEGAKPISFDEIVKHVKTGHPKWKDAHVLLAEAGVLRDGTRANWHVLIQDETQAILMLDSLMRQQGYYSHTQGDKVEWRKAIQKG